MSTVPLPDRGGDVSSDETSDETSQTRRLTRRPHPSPRGHNPLRRALALSPPSRILSLSNRMWRLLKEFLLFARQEKKWWLIPLVVMLVVLGAILIFASSSGIAWALYPFF